MIERLYVESFNGELRDELLDGEMVYSLKEAQVVVADWRLLYNGLRPHSSLKQRPPAPETPLLAASRWTTMRHPLRRGRWPWG